jgi:hypothetical protein
MHTSTFWSEQVVTAAASVGIVNPPGVGWTTACADAALASTENKQPIASRAPPAKPVRLDHMRRNLYTSAYADAHTSRYSIRAHA